MISGPFLWSAIGAAALAVGLGVQLGESTIGEINPIHFQGVPAHPRDRGAAVDPGAVPPPAQSAFAQAYGWADGNAARAAASGYEDFDFAPRPMVRPTADPIWQGESAPMTLPPWPPGRVSPHPEVERYTDYPIEQKLAEKPAPAEGEAYRDDVEEAESGD